MFPTDDAQRDAPRRQIFHKALILLLALAFPGTYHKEVHQLYRQLITAAAIISRLESLVMLFEGFNVEGEIPLLNLVIVVVFHFDFLDLMVKVTPLLASSLTKPL
jgi:hypothetical protein